MRNYADYYQRIKSDPVRYAAYLARKARERKAKLAYERERKRRWRTANAERNRILRDAHHAVERAIRSGRLMKPDVCQQCGSDRQVQAHHTSYEPDQWLNVEWLCTDCHNARHEHGFQDGNHGAVMTAGMGPEPERTPASPESEGIAAKGTTYGSLPPPERQGP
jgi:5-methylcytosine-specific restriction endonuclease McrA